MHSKGRNVFMAENQYKILSHAEFAARLGFTEEQLSGIGEYFKKNPTHLSSPIFTPSDAFPIDPASIHGTMEVIEQLRSSHVELERFRTDNQRLVEELKISNNKIADISQQLEDAQKNGRFSRVKDGVVALIGSIILAFILWFISLKLGIQL